MALIVLDTSAIIGVLLDEPEAPSLTASLLVHRTRCISEINVFELRVVMFRRLGVEGLVKAQRFLDGFAVNRIAFDHPVAEEAFAAFQRFGKGGGHPAQLNMGDCAAYATAQLQQSPLLFKGDDFSKTDVRRPRIDPPS